MAVLYTYKNDFKEDGSTLFQLHSVAQRKRWLTRVLNLKKDYQDLPGSSGNYEIVAQNYRKWLLRAHRFVTCFGKKLVPLDLREYINLVEGGVDVEVTDFPAAVGIAPVAPPKLPDGVTPEEAEVAAAGILKMAPLDWKK